MPPTLVSRLAGPITLGVGLLVIAAEVVLFATYRAADRIGTLENPLYLAAGFAYFVAFCGLLISIVVIHNHQAERAGAFGLVAAAAAMVGTMFLAGDLWFESFAVPWLGDVAPETFDKVGGLVMVGGFTSYVLFAAGWVLFGFASLRARVFPWPISVGIIIGGAIGFMALVPPYGLPLGIVIASLGMWMSRRTNARIIASAPATA